MTIETFVNCSKHTEYEQRLYEMYMNNQNLSCLHHDLPPGHGDTTSANNMPGQRSVTKAAAVMLYMCIMNV